MIATSIFTIALVLTIIVLLIKDWKHVYSLQDLSWQDILKHSIKYVIKYVAVVFIGGLIIFIGMLLDTDFLN